MNQLKNMGALTNKKIYVMGSVNNALLLKKGLRKCGIDIIAIVDNNPKKAGRCTVQDEEFEIIHSSTFFMLEDRQDIVLLIYSIRFWREMTDQMIRHGFREGENLFILEAPTLEKKLKYIHRANEIVNFFRNKYGKNVKLLVFHGPVGDNYFFAMFVREYCNKNGVENPVFLGTSSTSKIVDVYKFDPYWELDREDIVAIEYLYCFLGDKADHIKILQMWEFNFHFNRCRIRFDRRFHFLDTYRSYIYDLPEGVCPDIPVYKIDERISKIFDKLNLTKGKTVILAPFAYSIETQPSKVFWQKLVNMLIEKGYDVAVNINSTGEEENYLSGAASIQFPLNIAVPVLEYAGVFIGMRSGFCDVVSCAHCKKIVLYPKVELSEIDYDRHRTDLEFSCFSRMGIASNVFELEFELNKNEVYWSQFVSEVIGFL